MGCHVRDKKCQFYNNNLNKSGGAVENVESTTSKITSSTTTATITSTSETNCSYSVAGTLIAADSINLANSGCGSTGNTTCTDTQPSSVAAASNNIYISHNIQGLDMNLLDNNFPYILSEGTIMTPTTPLTNETTFFIANPNDDDIMSALQNQDNAEIKFKCKLCSFR